VGSTGRSFDDIARDLESLKQALIYMDADDITTEQTQSFAQQISVIRLQLKRLLDDQKALGVEIERRALGR
jgi:Holliday junction resolvasome RuvABC endonuclease subunit